MFLYMNLFRRICHVTRMFADTGEAAFSSITKNMRAWSLVTVESNLVVKSVEPPDHQGS